MPTAREGESTREDSPSLKGGGGGIGVSPEENFEFLALLCALLMGF